MLLFPVHIYKGKYPVLKPQLSLSKYTSILVRLGWLTAIFYGTAARKDGGTGGQAGATWDGPVAAIGGPRGVGEDGASVREDSAEAAGEDGASVREPNAAEMERLPLEKMGPPKGQKRM
jgi:hypothetical protein